MAQEAEHASRHRPAATGRDPVGAAGAENTSAKARLGELGSFIREQRTRARYSLRHLARVAGVSNPYLSQIERGLRKPSAEILQAIARALKISSETLYVKAGILEDRSETPDLESAILRDETLNERQRAALVEIYRSFRQENTAQEKPARKDPVEEDPARKDPARKSDGEGVGQPTDDPPTAGHPADERPAPGSRPPREPVDRSS